MADDASKIILRKNADGSTTKVVVKKVAKKVRIKVAAPKKKEEEAPEKEKSAEANKAGREGADDKAGADKKRKIFVARKKPARTGVESAIPPSEKTLHYQQKKKHEVHPEDAGPVDAEDREAFNKFNKQIRVSSEGDEFSNVPNKIEIPEVISIKDLAMKLNLKASQILKKLFNLGVMDLTVNDNIDAESATIVAAEFKCKVKVSSLLEETKVEEDKGDDADYIRRDPIVTVMGHVDHGKTSILDAIRKTDVVSSESGGITQHIGAYKVHTEKGNILFIDTPGHAAFSQMRARGANVTDVVILVVSAVDGVKPQTIEAINHSKAAGVPIIVAINKMDLKGADPEKVKKELSEHELISEDWGGETIFQQVSAMTKDGIKELLESVALQADILELKGNPKVRASGYVIESQVVQGKGNVVTLVLRNGSLKSGDAYVCGNFAGRIRAMFDDQGGSVKVAGPSDAVEIIGISGFPNAGDMFHVVTSEREAKKIADRRVHLEKENKAQNVKTVTLSNLFDTIKEGNREEVKVIINGDVFGSVEAIKDVLQKMQNEEVSVKVISTGTGGISENDVNLASTSDAMIIGFKVKASTKVRKLAEQENVTIKLYNVIYEIIDDIKDSLQGLLKSEEKEKVNATLEVRDVFKISKVGKVAGCFVSEGKVLSKNAVRLYRDGSLVHTGRISSLKHYKDEAKEVVAGSECGIMLEDFQDVKTGDTIECYQVESVERKLELNN